MFSGRWKQADPSPGRALRRPSGDDVQTTWPGPSLIAPSPFHPRGSVLALALVILLLMSLAGMAVLVNTKNELTISGNAAAGRNAFAGADAAAQIATIMGRILLHPELNTPDNVLTTASGTLPSFPLSVEINNSKFNMAALRNEGVKYDYTKRYILAGSYKGRVENSEDLSPYMIFTIPGKDSAGNAVDVTVATASFSMETILPTSSAGSGGSIGQGGYDPTGGDLRLQVLMTVTVNGRALTNAVSDASADSTSFDGGADEGPYSIITTIFREIM